MAIEEKLHTCLNLVEQNLGNAQLSADDLEGLLLWCTLWQKYQQISLNSSDLSLLQIKIEQGEAVEWLRNNPTLLDSLAIRIHLQRNHPDLLPAILQDSNLAPHLLADAEAVKTVLNNASLLAAMGNDVAAVTRLFTALAPNDMPADAAPFVRLVIARADLRRTLLAQGDNARRLAQWVLRVPALWGSIFNAAEVINPFWDSNEASEVLLSNSEALKFICRNNAARLALVGKNEQFQRNRWNIRKAVTGAGWHQVRWQREDTVSSLNSGMSGTAGYVLASLGYYSNRSASTTMKHFNNTYASTGRSSSQPNSLTPFDAVSFDGATFTESGDGYAYAQLWSPN